MLSLIIAIAAATSSPSDLTQVRLEQCLRSEGSSTGGETTCYDISRAAYQARIILATNALERLLDEDTFGVLKSESGAWLAYRTAHRAAMEEMLATRKGSMYAVMQAADEMEMARDRALRLEAQLRMMEIDR